MLLVPFKIGGVFFPFLGGSFSGGGNHRWSFRLDFSS